MRLARVRNMEIADYLVTNVGQSGGDPVWTYRPTQRYVPGAGVDQRVAMVDTGSTGAVTSRYYYHVNRLGSPQSFQSRTPSLYGRPEFKENRSVALAERANLRPGVRRNRRFRDPAAHV